MFNSLAHHLLLVGGESRILPPAKPVVLKMAEAGRKVVGALEAEVASQDMRAEIVMAKDLIHDGPKSLEQPLSPQAAPNGCSTLSAKRQLLPRWPDVVVWDSASGAVSVGVLVSYSASEVVGGNVVACDDVL